VNDVKLPTLRECDGEIWSNLGDRANEECFNKYERYDDCFAIPHVPAAQF
jgi:hypothetical protein